VTQPTSAPNANHTAGRGEATNLAAPKKLSRHRFIASEFLRFVLSVIRGSLLLYTTSFLPEQLVRHRIGDIFPIIGSFIQHP
jgi:hypothetical protein